MKLYTIIAFILWIGQSVTAQTITGRELLSKTIQFHDPDGNWGGLQAKLTFDQESQTGMKYKRIITFDNQGGDFIFLQKDDKKKIEFNLSSGNCKIKLNDSEQYSEEEAKKYRLSCDRVEMYRNYYTYLYGLPMKLTDEGTIVGENVSMEAFQGTEYYVLQVDYEESVGTDSWYFYISTATFAMEGYRFYQNGRKDNGEYITLDGILEFEGIKIPKVRKWYTNMEDKFLGTDNLVQMESLE